MKFCFISFKTCLVTCQTSKLLKVHNLRQQCELHFWNNTKLKHDKQNFAVKMKSKCVGF